MAGLRQAWTWIICLLSPWKDHTLGCSPLCQQSLIGYCSLPWLPSLLRTVITLCHAHLSVPPQSRPPQSRSCPRSPRWRRELVKNPPSRSCLIHAGAMRSQSPLFMVDTHNHAVHSLTATYRTCERYDSAANNGLQLCIELIVSFCLALSGS